MAAQKREKEETELKVPVNPPICTPPAPHLDDQSQTPSFSTSSRSPENQDPKPAEPRTSSANSPVRSGSMVSLKRPREVTRCSGSGCRKRVGLMGFRCRCGEVFCSEHRYSDRHDCSFDYKAAGREAIARENPVVRAAKILKV